MRSRGCFRIFHVCFGLWPAHIISQPPYRSFISSSSLWLLADGWKCASAAKENRAPLKIRVCLGTCRDCLMKSNAFGMSVGSFGRMSIHPESGKYTCPFHPHNNVGLLLALNVHSGEKKKKKLNDEEICVNIYCMSFGFSSKLKVVVPSSAPPPWMISHDVLEMIISWPRVPHPFIHELYSAIDDVCLCSCSIKRGWKQKKRKKKEQQ